MIWDNQLYGDYKAIAEYSGKYTCVIAGAGTGKSYALKRKVARLLEEGELPGSILAITFTRTAARDIHNDLNSLGVEGCNLVRACTLHSLCYSILSKHEVFRVMNRETRTLLEHEKDYLISDLSIRLGKIKPLREQLHAFESAWARLLSEKPGWPHSDMDRKFDAEMISWLNFHKCMLIGELVPLTIRYLRNNPTSQERKLYKHVIVDEYQDLNKAEQELIKLICEYNIPENRTLTVAGDDDQSIFVTLKYAHPEGIIKFKDEYPGTFEKTLTTCQRCPKKVINLANSFIIATNRKSKPKLLKPKKSAIDGEVSIIQWRRPDNEVSGIAKIIARKIQRGDVKPEEILVLTPRKQIGYEISEELNTLGIKAQTCFSDVLFSNNKLAQERYAYLSLLCNASDYVSFRVLLGIDVADKRSKPYEKIRQYCYKSGDTVFDALSKILSGKIVIKYTQSLVERYQYVNQILQKLSELELPELVNAIFPQNVSELSGLRKLALSSLEQAKDIHDLFDLMNTQIVEPEFPVTNDSVLVLTLYKAKGLTAKMVVIVNCLEGCIPSLGKYSNDEEKDQQIAEQERLFFVALTRTTKILIISSTAIMRRGDVAKMKVTAGTGWYWSQTSPSHFIDMLGENAPSPIIGEEYLMNLKNF